MSEIRVNNLTFSYESSYDNIFDNTTFLIDTDWKLGFIGRNGKGKTTFLNLLMGKYEYSGSITSNVHFDYFPFEVKNKNLNTLDVIKSIIAPFKKWEEQLHILEEKFQLINTIENEAFLEELNNEYSEILTQYMYHDGYQIEELIKKEIDKLSVKSNVLERPFMTLSNGEQSKLLLAGLFLKKNHFLLIDEPTNHLDIEGRTIVREYLSSKKGFILVSHDRDFIDHIVDHILSINRSNIEVMKGNFSTWQENKEQSDHFERLENEKLKKQISQLEASVKRTAGWSDAVESSKIGGGPCDRGYIGAKSAKMMKRAKAIETRRVRAVNEKSGLLKNIETVDSLKINLLEYPKERIIDFCDVSIGYSKNESEKDYLFTDLSFFVNQGDRIALSGRNGCGKSSIIKKIMSNESKNIIHEGTIKIANDLIISYVPQDTSLLKGKLMDYTKEHNLDEGLFLMALRKLDFPRVQFEKNMEEFSGGQKKKVLLAHSLICPAHLFIWDEPLNFVDVLSRIQLEELLLAFKPTMIFVEHDKVFLEKVATKIIDLDKLKG